jgi:D-alanyl-D-alanine carboxypeptidase
MRALACVLLLVSLAACGGSGKRQAARPDLQATLAALVHGASRAAPGATAFVAGPKGSWSGAAGWADVTKQVRMTPDARMRLESVSKLWTATVVLSLAEKHALRLDDPVERWLPGDFPYGKRITIRQLLSHTSGMIDNNDLAARPGYWFARVHDRSLRARLGRLAAALAENPATEFSPRIEVEAAAALPLLFAPGLGYHYSNIGYIVAGMIAERAGRAPLAQLYDRFIIEPLRLTSAAYAPGGTIPGPHPLGYSVRSDGTAVAATNWGSGALGAEGGIVANAQDEARFLVALMQGRILSKPFLKQLETPSAASGTYGLGTGIDETCAGTAYAHNGGGFGWASSVAVSGDGKRVAVLLLNGRATNGLADADTATALRDLFCAA